MTTIFFVIVCMSVVVYIKNRSRIRRQRVKQLTKQRQIELNKRRVRGAKYPHSIDLNVPSANEDESDIQCLHYLSNETMNIVTDSEYSNYMGGSSAWTPTTNRPSASATHSDSHQSLSSVTMLSCLSSQQYAAKSKSSKKRTKKRSKPQSFSPSPRAKSKSPRLTKARK